MKEKILKYFEEHREEMLSCIAELVAVNSVRGEAGEGMPFGPKPFEALEKALKTAERFGLKTQNFDGYVGTAELGAGEPELGILAHLDIVPAGEGWHSDPFEMKILSDRIIGRGVSDDKGPAVCALFAMKAVHDLGLPVTKNCRLILGCDEECGSGDLKHYFASHRPPKYSFTPDANFPVTNGEKGRFAKQFFKTADTSGESRRLASLNAGFASNAVPGFAQAEVFGVSEEELKTAALKAEQTGASFEISAGKVVCSGTAAHASLPETGNNPITALLEMLSFLELDDVSDGLVSSLKELFPHGRYNGEALGVDMSDKLGRTTLTLDIADFDGVNFSGCFDARTPMCANEENFAFVIKKKLEDKGFEIENTVMVKPHYVDESLPFVQTLIKSYESYSGDKGECISIGGGTYVHDIDGGVAFGAIGRDVNTNMHGADEFMLIDDLMMSAAIFTQVIAEVCK